MKILFDMHKRLCEDEGMTKTERELQNRIISNKDDIIAYLESEIRYLTYELRKAQDALRMYVDAQETA